MIERLTDEYIEEKLKNITNEDAKDYVHFLRFILSNMLEDITTETEYKKLEGYNKQVISFLDEINSYNFTDNLRQGDELLNQYLGLINTEISKATKFNNDDMFFFSYCAFGSEKNYVDNLNLLGLLEEGSVFLKLENTDEIELKRNDNNYSICLKYLKGKFIKSNFTFREVMLFLNAYITLANNTYSEEAKQHVLSDFTLEEILRIFNLR